MSGQPAFDRRMFVGAVLVADPMNSSFGNPGQRLQKGDELQVPMATVAASVDLAAGHLQRGEQARGAVAMSSSVMRVGSPGHIGSTGWCD